MKNMNKYQKLFLSHSSKDKHYGDAIVTLLLRVGLKKEQILYSSNPVCGIPIGRNIYEYLRETIDEGAYMVYLLSDNYYESIACMNEMGAAWMRQNDYLLLATPTFDYKNEKFQSGVADPRSLAVPMDNMERIQEFVNHIKEKFGIDADSIHEQAVLQEYLKKLNEIESEKQREESQSIVELESIVKNKEKKASEFIALGKTLWDKNKNYPAAMQQYLYASLISEGSKDCEIAYSRMIELAAIAQEYSDSWKICKEAVKHFPESDKIFGSRGYLECAEQKYEDAIVDCTRAIEGKKNRWYYNTRGRAFWGINKVYDALKDFHEAHRLDSEYAPAIKNLRILCHQVGMDNVVDRALKERQGDDYEMCRLYLECVLIADGNNERAKRELGKIAER